MIGVSACMAGPVLVFSQRQDAMTRCVAVLPRLPLARPSGEWSDLSQSVKERLHDWQRRVGNTELDLKINQKSIQRPLHLRIWAVDLSSYFDSDASDCTNSMRSD